MLPVVNRKKSRTRWRFHQKAGYRRKKKSLHASEQERSRCGAEGRALLQRAGFPLYNLSVSLRSTAPLVGEPLAKPFTLRGLPKPLLQGATATTAASGGNREELLGPRPAGCERQRSRRWEPQPGQWHRVSDDGEVVRRQSLPFVGKSGSRHRFLYLFVEVYGILSLRSIPAILMGKGVTLWPIF